MKITITYQNGNKITDNAHYVHYEDDWIYYGKKSDIECSVTLPVKVPMKNIKSFDITE